MKKSILLILCLVLLFALPSYAEKSTIIQFKDLPIAVQDTALKHVSSNDITKIERIKEEETIKYEIESSHQGVTKDITVAGNGALLETEQGVSFSQLPKEAQHQINKDYPGIKINELESATLHYYDVQGVVHGKVVEFRVFATGDIEDESPAETDAGD